MSCRAERDEDADAGEQRAERDEDADAGEQRAERDEDADAGEQRAGADDGVPTAAQRAGAGARLSTWWDHDGRFHLHYEAPGTDGALVEQALKEAKDALFTGGDPQATYAEALTEVANRSLSTLAVTSRASKYRIYLHLDVNGSWVNARGAIPRHLIDRFACDGTLQPVWESQGAPVSVGRSMRILPERSRRLVEDRDAVAATRAAPPRRSSRCITSVTGATGDPPTCTVRSASARSTTTATTAATTRSPGTRPGPPIRRLDLHDRHRLDHRRTALRQRVLGRAPTQPPGLVAPRSRTARTRVTGWEAPARQLASELSSTGEPYLGPTGEPLHARWVDFPPDPPAPCLSALPGGAESAPRHTEAGGDS